jgi:hypothetical protein
MDADVDPTAGELDAPAKGGSFDCKRSSKQR